MSDNLTAQMADMHKQLQFLWSDFYGDDRRKERGMIGDIKMLTVAVNRLSIVLVFFAIISLLNLLALVWVVLSL